MAYSSCVRVAALIANLLNAASDFDNLPDSVITGSAQLINWMSSGCALIEAKIAGMGYAVPIASTNTIFDYLADLEASYAAYRAESSRSSPRSAAGERTRAQQFKRDFNDGLDDLEEMDLTRLGITYTGKFYIGGISAADKETQESDTDRVSSRIKRGQFETGRVPQPSGNTRRDDEQDN